MMIDLLNGDALNKWMRQLRASGYDTFVAVKGSAPAGINYEDGTPVEKINIAWRCIETGEVFALEYGEVAH